jgi:hypothetical protein
MSSARWTLRAALAGAVLGAAALSAGDAAAQQTRPPSQPGWTFNVAPYLWVPAVDATLRYSVPPETGAARSTDISVDQSKLLDALDFAAMIAAEARYDRFTLVTDLIYLDLGSSSSRVKSVDVVQVGRDPVSSQLDAGTQSSLTGTLWTLAGGYTVAQGAWGNVDISAGFRLFYLDTKTNISLTTNVIGPNNQISLPRGAQLSESVTLFDGIIGLRGRFELGSGFSIPYSFDIGTGSSTLTWQAVGGLTYQTGWAGITAGYRYLYYDQGDNKLLQDFALQGPFLAVNFTF